jgi:hypothetical protein
MSMGMIMTITMAMDIIITIITGTTR